MLSIWETSHVWPNSSLQAAHLQAPHILIAGILSQPFPVRIDPVPDFLPARDVLSFHSFQQPEVISPFSPAVV